MSIIPTYEIAMAAGRDAANRQMRKNKRTAWTVEDWNRMVEVVDEILGDPPINQSAQ